MTIIIGIMIVGVILCLAVPEMLMKMFTSNPETIQIGVTAMRTICIGFVVSAVSVTSAGAFEALGKGIQSFMISFLRYVAVILPAAFLLSRLFGAGSIWNAFWIAEFVTAAAAWALYRKVMYPKDESEKEILTEKKE